jgi:hypothetical protein
VIAMLQNHQHEHRTMAVLGFGLVGEHQQVLKEYKWSSVRFYETGIKDFDWITHFNNY